MSSSVRQTAHLSDRRAHPSLQPVIRMSFISVLGPVSSRCVVACHVLCCRRTPMVLRAKCDTICRRCGINLFSEKRQDAQGNQDLFDKGTCFPKTIRCYLFKRDSVWESPLFKSCRAVTSVIDCLSEDCHRYEKDACLYHERMRQIQMSFSKSYSQKRFNRKSPFQNSSVSRETGFSLLLENLNLQD